MEIQSLPCITLGSKHVLAKHVFTPKEDARLLKIIQGLKRKNINWKSIAKRMTNRTPRQCKDRYLHYLSPELNTGEFTPEEDNQIIKFYEEYGNKWSALSKIMKGRSPNSIRLRCLALLNEKDPKKQCKDSKEDGNDKPTTTETKKEQEATPLDLLFDQMSNMKINIFDPSFSFVDPFNS